MTSPQTSTLDSRSSNSQTPNPEVAISVRNLTKIYPLYDKHIDRMKEALHPFKKKYHHDFYALKDVSFEIKKGETVGIIGKNGAGKSTLLKILTGVLTPTSGSVQVNGRVSSLLELGTGFSYELTGIQNIFFYGTVNGISREEMEKKVDEIIAFADIGEFINQPVKVYSSGMFARLAFAVAINIEPEILLVDEVLSVGDIVFSQKCYSFFRSFIDRGGTLILVSHSTQSVLDLCRGAIWIKNGVVKKNDISKNVIRDYMASSHQEVNDDETIIVKENLSDKIFDNSNSIKDTLATHNLLQEIKLFDFDSKATLWGAGGASIENIEIFDSGGNKLTIIEDCGLITIRVHCLSTVKLFLPIVGVQIRDKRGVILWCDNTFLTYLKKQLPEIEPGEEFYTDFSIFLPYLQAGEYTLGAAIANGSQDSFIQHCRKDDALKFSVIKSHNVFGIFGMPLKNCTISIK